MNNLLERIFDEIIYHEEDSWLITQNIEKHIDELITPYKDTLSQKDIEKLKDLMYCSAKNAEQEGFELGMKYLTKFIMNLLS